MIIKRDLVILYQTLSPLHSAISWLHLNQQRLRFERIVFRLVPQLVVGRSGGGRSGRSYMLVDALFNRILQQHTGNSWLRHIGHSSGGCWSKRPCKIRLC